MLFVPVLPHELGVPLPPAFGVGVVVGSWVGALVSPGISVGAGFAQQNEVCPL